MGALAVPAVGTYAAGQTSSPRGPSQAQAPLQLSGNRPPTDPSGEGVTHVVQRGENLSSISKRYDTTVAAIQRANGLRGTLIRAGQRLSIAGGTDATRASSRAATSATAVPSSEPVTHIVGRGENLSSISKRYDTTVAAIQRANGLRGTLIRAGQRLSMAGGTDATRASSRAATSVTAVPSSEPVTHVVGRGENLSSISKRYDTTVAAIQRANGLRGTLIRAGQRLSIAGGTDATRASSRAATSATAVPSSERVTHIVGRGENLSSISKRYDTTVAAIQRANGLRGTLIRTGQRLSIAGGTDATRASSRAATSATAVPSSEPVTHVVGRGENLSSISKRYDTTVAAIQRANGLRGTLIRAGQRLSIAGGTDATRASSRAATSATAVPSSERVTHVVGRGENLSSISKRYGTTVAAIQRANGLRGTLIRAGQRLSIAGGTDATRASSRAATSATAVPSSERVTHIVGRGENLSSISKRYGTTVAAIQRANGLRGTLIRAGQRLSIAGGTDATRASSRAATSATAVPSSERVTHVVGRGENLSSISKRYGTTVAAIQRANGLRGTLIRAGQRLSIVGRTGAAPSAVATSSTTSRRGEEVTHVVRRGENLSSISKRYGTTVAAVRRREWVAGNRHPTRPATGGLHHTNSRAAVPGEPERTEVLGQ